MRAVLLTSREGRWAAPRALKSPSPRPAGEARRPPVPENKQHLQGWLNSY
ncbi:MAG: hypothetical protein RI973_299 [Bacteroidota bacterium]|jgi:hypothetical protein